MKNIAIIRSVDIVQAEPNLSKVYDKLFSANDINIKLYYSDGDIKRTNFKGKSEHFNNNDNLYVLAKKIAQFSPDIVISISVPDNNALRDAVLKEILLKKYGITMVMHNVDSTMLLSNKWETNSWLRHKGYKTSKSVHISLEMLQKLSSNTKEYKAYIDGTLFMLSEMHAPFVIKPLWNSMSLGVVFLESIDDVKNYIIKNPSQDYIVEEKANGNLYGIEALVNGESRLVQPLVKKCLLNNNELMPFGHLRYGQVQINPKIYEKILSTVNSIIDDLHLQGSVEFELIINEEDFKIIEINPRVSGMSNLSAAISNVNPYTWLINSNFYKLNNAYSKNNFVAEFPLDSVSEKLISNQNAYKNILSINHETYHNGDKKWKILFTGKDLNEVYKRIINLEKHNYIKISSNIIKEFQNELK